MSVVKDKTVTTVADLVISALVKNEQRQPGQ